MWCIIFLHLAHSDIWCIFEKAIISLNVPTKKFFITTKLYTTPAYSYKPSKPYELRAIETYTKLIGQVKWGNLVASTYIIVFLRLYISETIGLLHHIWSNLNNYNYKFYRKSLQNLYNHFPTIVQVFRSVIPSCHYFYMEKYNR